MTNALKRGTVEYAGWLADKLHNTNDYGKEAAAEMTDALKQAAPQPAAPSVAERLGVDWPGCNYLNPPGRICTKCGKDHGAYRAKLAEVWHQGFAAGEKWVEARQEFWQTHEYGDSPEPEPNPYKVKP